MSILLSLLLAKNFIVLFLFLLVIFNNLLTVPFVKEKVKVKPALAIPTGAPIILVNEISGTPPVVTLKTIKFYLYSQKL